MIIYDYTCPSMVIVGNFFISSELIAMYMVGPCAFHFQPIVWIKKNHILCVQYSKGSAVPLGSKKYFIRGF